MGSIARFPSLPAALSSVVADLVIDAVRPGVLDDVPAADRLAALCDRIAEGVVALDLDGRVLYANRAGGALFGHPTLTPFVGRPLRDAIATPGLADHPTLLLLDEVGRLGGDVVVGDEGPRVAGSALGRDAHRVARVGELTLLIHGAAIDGERTRAGYDSFRRGEAELLAQLTRDLAAAAHARDDTLTHLAQGAMTLLDASGAAVTFVEDAPPGRMRLAIAAGSLAPFTGDTPSHEGTLTGEVLRTRQVAISNHARRDRRLDSPFVTGAGVEQVAVAPLVVEERVVGSIVVINSTTGSFSAADGALLRSLAEHGALAVRNGELIALAEARAREQRAIGDIVRHLNQSLEFERVVELVASHARLLLQGRGATLFLLEEEELVVAARAGEVGVGIGERLPLESVFAAEAVRSGHPRRIPDVQSVRERWPGSARVVGDAPTDLLAVPLRIGPRTIGAVSVFGTGHRASPAQDEELLALLATHAAVAVENARLYRAAARTAEHMAVLARTAGAIALGLSPEALYAAIGDIVTNSLRACGYSLYALGPGGEPQLIHAEGVGAGRNPATKEGWFAALVRTFDARRALWIDDLAGPDAAACGAASGMAGARLEELRADGIRSLAILPLGTDDRTVGYLSLRYATRCAFREDDRRLLRGFASQLAVALGNVQLFEAQRRERAVAETTAAISRAALATASPEELGDEILRVVADVVPTQSASLGVVRPDGSLRIIASRGESSAVRGQLLPPDPKRDEALRAPDTVHWVPDGRSELPPEVAAGVPAEAITLLPLVAKGHGVGMIAFGSPVGERIAADRLEVLRRFTAPIALALEALLLGEEERRMQDRLRQHEKLAALGELVAGVAHELNNPLAGISLHAEFLLDGETDPERLESARLVRQEADRAARVIRDLLAFARKSPPVRTTVDLTAVVESIVRMRAYQLRSAGIELVERYESGATPVLGDAQRLQQVVLNLLTNAEQAMAGAPVRRLEVRTERVGGMVSFEVRDTGAGMAPEVRTRVFEPFFTTKPEGVGTGLGLSVSYGIVQSHQGTIDVESASGTGTTFRVMIPAAPADTPGSPPHRP